METETHRKTDALGRTGELVVIYLPVGWESPSVPNAVVAWEYSWLHDGGRAGLNTLKKLQVRWPVPKLRRISTENYLTLADLPGLPHLEHYSLSLPVARQIARCSVQISFPIPSMHTALLKSLSTFQPSTTHIRFIVPSSINRPYLHDASTETASHRFPF